ncbi:Patatin-03 [Datura stramonium]|uniref:Patatin-03 n=1 Tax=Datura stramonium TaxID=4076 RepID=A0ABS8SME7_DATST|nr:Patatin-03 [Datura stramonium]
MSDICYGTAAAEIYFPPYHFVTDDGKGNQTDFNLVDGGTAAANPALVALSIASRRAAEEDPAFASIKKLNYTGVLLLSLGTGTTRDVDKTYTAEETAGWGAYEWLFHNYPPSPLLQFSNTGGSYMNDYYIATLFHALSADKNYLRIQEYALTGSTTAMDDATEANMNLLVQVGENLLKKPVFEKGPETNEEALKR